MGSGVHPVHAPSSRWLGERERRGVSLGYFLGTQYHERWSGIWLAVGSLHTKACECDWDWNRGQQQRFFLEFGFRVLWKGEHREKPSWSARFQDARPGNRGMAEMALQKGVTARRGGSGGGSVAHPGSAPAPLPQLSLARLAAAPPLDLGAASPYPPPPPPTPRCSCCRRTILHVANGGDARGRPQVRARGSRRREGGGAAADARARAAPALSARAKLWSARLLGMRRLGVLSLGSSRLSGSPTAFYPSCSEASLYPGSFSSSAPVTRAFARSRRFMMAGCCNELNFLDLFLIL